MGCFLGCFGGEKDHKGRKYRINKGSPQAQRNGFKKNVETGVGAEQIDVAAKKIVSAKPDSELVSELLNKPMEEKGTCPSPSPSRSQRKRVTFSANVTTYEHVSVQESADFLPKFSTNTEKENGAFESSRRSHSVSEDDNSVISSVGSYPQNHNYYSARDGDDEPEEYGDIDLDDLDDELDDEYDYENSDEENCVKVLGQKVWVESVLTESDGSEVQNSSPNNEAESRMDEENSVKILGQKVWAESVLTESDGSEVQNSSPNNEAESPMVVLRKTKARDRSENVNSLLNPIENIAQWKAAKSKGKLNPLMAQKENFSANFDVPRVSFCSEPTVFKSKIDKSKGGNRVVEVNTSLSSWLVSPEVSNKTTSSLTSFEDRPILGAWTVDELRHISASSSPRKSPAQIVDEMPIVGTVGTYWNHSRSAYA